MNTIYWLQMNSFLRLFISAVAMVLLALAVSAQNVSTVQLITIDGYFFLKIAKSKNSGLRSKIIREF